jgi:hypothetical protein
MFVSYVSCIWYDSATKKIVAINKETDEQLEDEEAREAIGAKGTKWKPDSV